MKKVEINRDVQELFWYKLYDFYRPTLSASLWINLRDELEDYDTPVNDIQDFLKGF